MAGRSMPSGFRAGQKELRELRVEGYKKGKWIANQILWLRLKAKEQ